MKRMIRVGLAEKAVFKQRSERVEGRISALQESISGRGDSKYKDLR